MSRVPSDDKGIDDIRYDWKGVIEGGAIFKDSNYLKENNKPVVVLSGNNHLLPFAIHHGQS